MQKNNRTEPVCIPVVPIPYVEREGLLHSITQQVTEHIQVQGRLSQKEQEQFVTLLACLRRRQALPVLTVEKLYLKQKQGMTQFIDALYKDAIRRLHLLRRLLEEEWFMQEIQSQNCLPSVPQVFCPCIPTPQYSGDGWQSTISQAILPLCPRGAGVSEVEFVIRVRRRFHLSTKDVIQLIRALIAQEKLSKDPVTCWLKRVNTHA
jgi:hypothetical protein